MTTLTRTEWSDDVRGVGGSHASARGRARHARHLRRRARRDVRLELRPPPRALLRRAVQRPRPSHAQHPPLPGAAEYVVDHAEDEVIFVDRSLLKVLWPLVDGFGGPPHRRDGRRRRRSPRGRAHPRLRGAARRAPSRPSSTSPTRTRPPPCVTRAARRATRRASSTRTARACCTRSARCWRTRWRSRERDVVMPVVPMFHANAVGARARRRDGRQRVRVPRPADDPGRDREADGGREGDARGRRADDLDGRARRARGPRHRLRCGRSCAAARRSRRCSRRPIARGSASRSCTPGA